VNPVSTIKAYTARASASPNISYHSSQVVMYRFAPKPSNFDALCCAENLSLSQYSVKTAYIHSRHWERVHRHFGVSLARIVGGVAMAFVVSSYDGGGAWVFVCDVFVFGIFVSEGPLSYPDECALEL
jgi:hypothetical protein